MAPTIVEIVPIRSNVYKGVEVFGSTPPLRVCETALVSPFLTVGATALVIFLFMVGETFLVAPFLAGGVIALGALLLTGGATDLVPQNPFVMVLVFRETTPFLASNCPCTVAPLAAVIDCIAKMCPTK